MAVYIDGQQRDRQLNVVEAGDTTADDHLDLERVGYDTDQGRHTYRDNTTGQHYIGDEGNRYGNIEPLYHTSSTPPVERPRWSEYPPPRPSPSSYDRYPTWRYFAPFAVIILLALGLLFRYVDSGDNGPAMTRPPNALKCAEDFKAYTIAPDDTCWSIAESGGTTVEDLTKANAFLDCDKLVPGKQLCVRTSMNSV